MKRLDFFTLTGLFVISVMFYSCGTTKVATNSTSADDNPYGKAVQQDICEVMQEEKPATRAVGNGQHFKLSTAKNIAMAQARAQFANSIAAAIIAATEDFGIDLSKYAGDDNQGQSVSDQAGTAEDLVLSVAKEVVTNTMVIKTSTYFKPNKQYNVFVCLEYKDGANALAERAQKKLVDRIPEDQAKKILDQRDKFNEQIVNFLEKSNNTDM